MNGGGAVAKPKLEVNPGVAHRLVGDDVLLVHLETNQVYTLNRTGGRIWELLVQHGDRDQVVRELREEFDVVEAELTSEVDELIARLIEGGLLVASV
jgi:Coenzyme PQQ synthesis protein D (PqqD)